MIQLPINHHAALAWLEAPAPEILRRAITRRRWKKHARQAALRRSERLSRLAEPLPFASRRWE